MAAKFAFLIAATVFFAILAMDIAVPAAVLSVMALSNWLVLSVGAPDGSMTRGTA